METRTKVIGGIAVAVAIGIGSLLPSEDDGKQVPAASSIAAAPATAEPTVAPTVEPVEPVEPVETTPPAPPVTKAPKPSKASGGVEWAKFRPGLQDDIDSEKSCTTLQTRFIAAVTNLDERHQENYGLSSYLLSALADRDCPA